MLACRFHGAVCEFLKMGGPFRRNKMIRGILGFFLGLYRANFQEHPYLCDSRASQMNFRSFS